MGTLQKFFINARYLKKHKHLCLGTFIILILIIFGAPLHLLEKDFYTEFNYPYNGDIEQLVFDLKNGLSPHVPPINYYNFKFNALDKCRNKSLRLVFLVKSAPEHQKARAAIRKSWGLEKRFVDVKIATVFLIGETTSIETKQKLEDEVVAYKDLVMANFTDSYYNNTYKTMAGFYWAMKYCANAKYYMFVDDDYYVSAKNILRFLRYPANYPGYLIQKKEDFPDYDSVFETFRLYAGYVFNSSPHRHFTSRWYISLSEYPYHMWPPYVTAGAYVLSKQTLEDMYYASFYTKHFRFDDIYVGLLAYKTNIKPLHSNYFGFYENHNYDFKYMVASHGFKDTEKMLKLWAEQKSKAFA